MAVLGGVLTTLNAIFFSRIDIFSNLNLFIDFIVFPLFMIFASLWLKKRIVIVSFVLFLVGFTLEVLSNFYPLGNMGYLKIYAILIITSCLIMCFAAFSESKKGWLMKKSKQIERQIVLSLSVIPLLTIICFFIFN